MQKILIKIKNKILMMKMMMMKNNLKMWKIAMM